MSKSLKRVRAALIEGGDADTIIEVGQSRTAEEAAVAAGCDIDQIVKSIIFKGAESGHIVLFLTAGGQRVCADKATALAGQQLERAGADLVRAETGFAIGGVSPLGHPAPIPTFFDPHLLAFREIWAAAGTPRHIFSMTPQRLLERTGATQADFTE